MSQDTPPDVPTPQPTPPPPESPAKKARKFGSALVAALSLIGLIIGIIGGSLGILPERERNNVLYSVGIIGASETPVPTQTPTPTYTPTLTITPTSLPTATIAPTHTPTDTATPTATLTATPTETPSPTLTPTLTVTPMEGVPAAAGEVLAVVAQFSGEYNPQVDVVEALQAAAQELDGVRVVAIGHAIANATEAERIRDLYNAAMVVYGRVSEGGVTVYYDVTPTQARFQVGGIVRAQASEVENFQVFIYSGMDINYVLGLTMGQLHYFDGNYTAARQALRLAESALAGEQARLDELKAEILYLYKGLVLKALDDNAGAVAAFDRAIELDAAFAVAYLDRGMVRAEVNDLGGAIEDFNRAIAFDPTIPEAFYNRGTALARQGQLEEALVDLNRAVELRPDYLNALLNRGLAYVQLGRYQAAVNDFDAAIAIDEHSASAYARRGNAYVNLGSYPAAESDFSRAIEIDPDYEYAYSSRASVRNRLGDLEGAVTDYTHALALNISPETYVFRGQMFVQLQKYASAIADFDRALAIDPEFALAFRGRGVAHYLAGDDPQALADLRRYAELAEPIEDEVQNLIDELAAQLE